MKKYPLVSVIMPVYNGSRFVAKAVQSILGQSYPYFELIVVDDGSTDRTWEILTAFQKAYPKTVRIYRFTKNQGESAAANFAFRKTRGNFIARMDADDISRKHRLTKQVAYMKKHPGVIVLGGQASVINSQGKRIGAKHAPTTHQGLYKAFAFVNPMIHPSIMYRKNLLPKRGKVYHNRFESTDDYHTYFELLNHGKFANLPQELVSYRVHGSNKSLTNFKEKFWTDTKVRLAAVSKFGYKAPILMYPVILAQAAIVLMLPEKILMELFFWIRGIKRANLKMHTYTKKSKFATIKAYALTPSQNS